jgi:antirestriction protein ArdC
MPSQNDIREQITNQIVEALEKGGTPPWRRPWRLGPNGGAPCNVQSKRPYRGLNPLLLSLHADRHGLNSKWYGTFRQWKAMGGRVARRPSHVPEGEWGCKIVYRSPVTKTVTNDEGEEEPDRFYVFRLFSAFNLDQVEGSHLDHLRGRRSRYH